MDIYEELANDHNKLKPLLGKLVSATENDANTKHLLDQIHNLLIPHSRAEEAVFYNSLKEDREGKELVDHSFAEHMQAEAILRTLQGLDKINVEWTTAAKRLRESILHHIEDEEDRVFPGAKLIIFDKEAVQLAEAFRRAKELAAEQGDLKNSMDLITNMLPKWVRNRDKIKSA
jgi:hemerythrin superfamily protein